MRSGTRRSRKPRARDEPARPFARGFELDARDVVFEDDELLVVCKPEGLPAHATVDRGRPNLHDAVRRYLERGGGGYAALHHRLDVDTSGLMLFTKSKRWNAEVARMFAQHTIEKAYRAVVSGAPVPSEGRWRVDDFLGRVATNPSRYGAVRAGGDRAITDFEVLETFGAGGAGGAALVARPRSGRAHQIRVHLAGSGRPIVGDRLYGGRPAARLMLHAWKLGFVHPGTGERVELSTAPPATFEAVLDAIRRDATPP